MRVTALAVAAALTLAVATGCAGNKPQHQDGAAGPAGLPTPSTTTSNSASAAPTGPAPSGTPATDTPVANGGTGTAGPPSRCKTSQLAVDIEQYTPPGKAGSEQDARVRLTNGGSRCTMSGYIGLQLFAGPQPRETKVVEANGPPQTVTIDRGQSAWAHIAWGFLPNADEQNVEPECGPRPTGAAVTPPGQTDSIRVTEEFGRVCHHGEVYMSPVTATRPA